MHIVFNGSVRWILKNCLCELIINCAHMRYSILLSNQRSTRRFGLANIVCVFACPLRSVGYITLGWLNITVPIEKCTGQYLDPEDSQVRYTRHCRLFWRNNTVYATRVWSPSLFSPSPSLLLTNALLPQTELETCIIRLYDAILHNPVGLCFASNKSWSCKSFTLFTMSRRGYDVAIANNGASPLYR